MKKQKVFLLSAALIVCSVFLIGAPSACEPRFWADPDAMEELQRPARARIAVRSIIKYRYGEQTEATIPTYTKQEITVGQLWLSSREIEKIDMLPRAGNPGYYDLEITLTDKGRREWIMLSNANARNYLSFIIDGIHYRSFKPRMLTSDNDLKVILDGPFDQATASELVHHSEFNYIKLNGNKTLFGY